MDDVVKRWRGEAAKAAARGAVRSARRAMDELLGTGEDEPPPPEADERAERVRKTREAADRRLAEREEARAKAAKKP